ncbi:MAG TPA: energy-coupling factor transporter ATPase [Bacilli bacterium]|nr:energy-coupling factor transporter ATPase [Bacilli bacterium]
MAINFRKVSYSYSALKKNKKVKFAVSDVNLEIAEKDEFIAIVGHTGSGKSTLVQLMNALLVPSLGEIDILGTTITPHAKVKLKPIRKQVGLVFQFPEYQLFEETSLKDITFGPKNFGIPTEEAIQKALDVARLVGLSDDILKKSPFAISGGEMRKVAIAGILASNPDILILDEPTVGLDPFGKSELLKLLKRINEEEHKTIIIITHDMEVVSQVAKRVIVLDNAKIVYDGDMKALFKNDEFLINHNLDYPEIMKLMRSLKERLGVDIDIYQYSIEEAYQELSRVLGD